MKTQQRMTLLVAILAGTALLSAGCDNRPSTPTVGQKVDKAADKVADTADKAVVVVDDAGITTKVKAAVLAEPGLKTLQIGVDTKNGVVTLTGTVETMPLKQRAAQIAQSVDGVRSVVDNLVVKTT